MIVPSLSACVLKTIDSCDMVCPYTFKLQVIQKALWQWASGEAASEETLEAVVADLYTGCLVLYGHFGNKTPIIWQGSRIRCNTCRDLQSRRSSSCSYFTLCGEKKPSLKNSRMQQLSKYSKGKGILKSVTIIEASLYCQLLGRSLQESY